MTHLYYGDPTQEFSDQLAMTLLDNGADILEIGIPYSDPVCDGEVFQRACVRALQAGMTPLKVFEGIEKLRSKGYKQPIYVTTYFGPVFKMGVEKFFQKVKQVGGQGVIVPDILYEEQRGMDLVQFATPYSTEKRLKKILKNARGFVYCMSVPGVTGARETVETQVKETIAKVKKVSKLPTYVGFGISKPEHVRTVLGMGADGVIVGSAIGRIYEKYLDSPEKALPEIADFVKSLKEVTI